MARSRKRESMEDRAAEYVDSSLMTRRLRYKREISARIEGRYGVYRVRVQLGQRLNGTCTCPSEWWPCKHVHALSATWKANPGSFADLEQVLKDLSTQPRDKLVQTLCKMVLAAPECLAGLGLRGFELDEDDDDELDEADEWGG